LNLVKDLFVHLGLKESLLVFEAESGFNVSCSRMLLPIFVFIFLKHLFPDCFKKSACKKKELQDTLRVTNLDSLSVLECLIENVLSGKNTESNVELKSSALEPKSYQQPVNLSERSELNESQLAESKLGDLSTDMDGSMGDFESAGKWTPPNREALAKEVSGSKETPQPAQSGVLPPSSQTEGFGYDDEEVEEDLDAGSVSSVDQSGHVSPAKNESFDVNQEKQSPKTKYAAGNVDEFSSFEADSPVSKPASKPVSGLPSRESDTAERGALWRISNNSGNNSVANRGGLQQAVDDSFEEEESVARADETNESLAEVTGVLPESKPLHEPEEEPELEKQSGGAKDHAELDDRKEEKEEKDGDAKEHNIETESIEEEPATAMSPGSKDGLGRDVDDADDFPEEEEALEEDEEEEEAGKMSGHLRPANTSDFDAIDRLARDDDRSGDSESIASRRNRIAVRRAAGRSSGADADDKDSPASSRGGAAGAKASVFRMGQVGHLSAISDCFMFFFHLRFFLALLVTEFYFSLPNGLGSRQWRWQGPQP
jgi:hypothetical protein